MTFKVELSVLATQHIEETYLWIQQTNPSAADKWFNGVMTALNSLKDSPRRCSKIPEQDEFTQEIRHLIYRKKYRIIFTVQDATETVYILAVRHTSREPLEGKDLEEIL
ncbi:type II toxin-antitoxin system RelE/ParE family toxin [Fischerella sp. PCC 9605]|uniref:type II toxin-antitoxin system RelE/ParE family toxin n=1 Tax=Fischerella sp. PCC 9605 TaxID=1173024 RepID=UPI000478FC59|nr:type II toxin-antitoxin system RelE/ParE family toxin [Fischerella sp. PCC 9605]